MKVLRLISTLILNLACLSSGSFCLADTSSTQTSAQELYVLNFDQVPELREALQIMASELGKNSPERHKALSDHIQKDPRNALKVITLTEDCTRGKSDYGVAAYQFISLERNKTSFPGETRQMLRRSFCDFCQFVLQYELSILTEEQSHLIQSLGIITNENLDKLIFSKASTKNSIWAYLPYCIRHFFFS